MPENRAQSMDVEKVTQALNLKTQSAALVKVTPEDSVARCCSHEPIERKVEVASSRAPFVVPTAYIDRYADKLPSRINNLSPRPFAGFVRFVSGLLIAGMAGSFSNAYFTESTDRFGGPPYVKHFCSAEQISDKDLAFSQMFVALAEGERKEPQSKRFINLIARFADQLGGDGRYLEAQAQFARASVFCASASPELREQKRSFLISEADSEDAAYEHFLKDKVDTNLMQKVEDAGSIFQKSAVAGHSWRAFRAFLKAGQLSADDKNFEHARLDFNIAENILKSQLQNNKTVREILLEARWRAELQCVIETVSTLPLVSLSTAQNIGQSENSVQEFSPLAAAQSFEFEKIESALQQAEIRRGQKFYGETRVSQMYAEIAEQTLSYDDVSCKLIRWEEACPRSAKPLVAQAFWFNLKTEMEVKAYAADTIPDAVRTHGFERLLQGAKALNRALLLEPAIACEPSVLQAIQDNLNTANILLGLDYNDSRLVSDLKSANIRVRGNLAQFYFNEITFNANGKAWKPNIFRKLLKKSLQEAVQIGDDAGAEYYARAVYAAQQPYGWLELDKDEFAKGDQLLSVKTRDTN